MRSPVAHGRVTRLDAAAAEAVAGVRAVLTPDSTLSFRMRSGPLSAEPEYAGHDFASWLWMRLAEASEERQEP